MAYPRTSQGGQFVLPGADHLSARRRVPHTGAHRFCVRPECRIPCTRPRGARSSGTFSMQYGQHAKGEGERWSRWRKNKEEARQKCGGISVNGGGANDTESYRCHRHSRLHLSVSIGWLVALPLRACLSWTVYMAAYMGVDAAHGRLPIMCI